jgi:phosphoribosylaminoimidazole-succinocarboxamide synthase
MTLSAENFQRALASPLEGTDLPLLGSKYEGKVRDNYTKDGQRTIIVTDRISAFDRVLGTLPLKGQILNWVAAWWFDRTKHIAPNHVISVPDPNVMIVHECTPLPVEMIVRAYLTGSTSTSIWVHYENGRREYCGHQLPDGMAKHQKLPEVLLTPSTKAAHGDHDVSASRDQILEITGMPAEDFDVAAGLAMELFAFGQQLCRQRGLILVDTKYEFGKTPDGRIVVIDEIHTPDSSRFWFENSYEERVRAGQQPESFDKEYVRRYLKDCGFTGDGAIPPIPDEVKVEATKRYIAAVETITGEPFRPDLEPPLPRIQKNLGLR